MKISWKRDEQKFQEICRKSSCICLLACPFINKHWKSICWYTPRINKSQSVPKDTYEQHFQAVSIILRLRIHTRGKNKEMNTQRKKPNCMRHQLINYRNFRKSERQRHKQFILPYLIFNHIIMRICVKHYHRVSKNICSICASEWTRVAFTIAFSELLHYAINLLCLPR